MDNFTGQNVIEYNKSFATEEQCKSYLEHLKWSDGFQCVICNHDQYFKGHFPFTRACKKCRRIDSVTANTLSGLTQLCKFAMRVCQETALAL